MEKVKFNTTVSTAAADVNNERTAKLHAVRELFSAYVQGLNTVTELVMRVQGVDGAHIQHIDAEAGTITIVEIMDTKFAEGIAVETTIYL